MSVTDALLHRCELIARYSAMNLQNKEIAAHLGMSEASVCRLKQTPLYRKIQGQVFSYQLTELDKKLANDPMRMRAMVKDAVPASLRFLVDQVKNPKDVKSALIAAKEILDRDPDRQFLRHKERDANAGAASADELPKSAITAAAEVAETMSMGKPPTDKIQ